MRFPASNATLRPLGIGEVLDRAVTLCVSFFLPLATIYLAYAVPLAVVTFFSTQSFSRIVATVTDVLRSGHGSPTADQIAQAMNGTPSDTGWALVAVGFALFVSPLPTAALIEATMAFYLQRKTSFGQAYRVALDRYFPMLGVTLLFGLTGGVLYLAVVFIVVFLVVGLTLITAAAKAVGIILALVLVSIFGLAGIGLLLVIVLALQIAYFTCVVERATFTDAYIRALKRTFSGLGLRRSLLIGLIYIAIGLGIGFLSLAGVAVLVALVHSPILGTVYETIVRVATAAFTTAFIGIFYLDLRVREEGLDLQLEAERVSAAASAQA